MRCLSPLAGSLSVVLLPACGVFTLRAQDAVQSRALEDLDCGDVTVTMTPDGRYQASGCGKSRLYACDREIATAVGKPGAIAAVGCRAVDTVSSGAASAVSASATRTLGPP
jgi:hypothetical protein